MVVSPKLTSMMSPRTFSWLNKLTNFLLPRALTSRLRTTSHLKCSSHRLRLKAKDSSLPLRVDRPARSIGLSILWPYTVAIPIKTLLWRISHICLRAWLTIWFIVYRILSHCLIQILSKKDKDWLDLQFRAWLMHFRPVTTIWLLQELDKIVLIIRIMVSIQISRRNLKREISNLMKSRQQEGAIKQVQITRFLQMMRWLSQVFKDQDLEGESLSI